MAEVSGMSLPIVERLKGELADVQHELQHDLPSRLEEARAHGDLRENAEYEAAKHRQGMLRARVAHLQTRIRELSVYTIAQIPRDRVSYGSRVTVEDADSGDRIEYRLVFPEEVDASAGLISVSSPIGQGLMNRAEGDEVVVQTPRGRKAYQVVNVVTLHEQEGPGRTARS
jgi:transcription elongation factor GreA